MSSVPTCVMVVEALFDMGNYYWQFIKDYSKKMQPLIQLTKKDKSFEWTAECQKSFDQWKEVLTGPDIMTYSTDGGVLILDTDASLDTFWGSAVTGQGWVEHTIAYG